MNALPVSDSHVSDLRWDQLLACELSPALEAAARAHAETCAPCAARLAELTRERDAFAAQVRPAALPVSRPRPRRARARGAWMAAPAVLLAAAAAVVLMTRARSDAPDGDGGGGDSGTRAKGTGPALIVAAGRADRLAIVASGDHVHAGDRVQAGYSATRDGFGAVLSRDGSGHVMAYVPSRGDAMVALPAGTSRSFPESTVLDALAGDEHLIVVWCDAARPLAPMIAALEADLDVAAPAGCTFRHVVLGKDVAPR